MKSIPEASRDKPKSGRSSRKSCHLKPLRTKVCWPFCCSWPPSRGRSRADPVSPRRPRRRRPHACARAADQDSAAVLRVAADVEVHVAVRRVRVRALDQPPHQHDHLRDMARRPGLDIRRQAAERVVGPGERPLIPLGNRPPGGPLMTGGVQDLVLDVGDVPAERHLVASGTRMSKLIAERTWPIGRPAHRGRPPAAIRGRPARRDRESPPRRLQHAPAAAGRRSPHRRAWPDRRLHQHRADHDLQPA